ncbi:MAG: hypothetical protein ACKOA8_00505 [Deltaproteobacteria bacterium]
MVLLKSISLLFLTLFAQFVFSAQLPTGLTPSELTTLIRVISFGNVTRVMRSAEAYPTFPGLKLAIETPLVPSGSLSELGNGSASLPMVIPAPRLNITKGLGMGLEVSLAISTQSITKTMGTEGVLAKWTYLEEKEAFLTSSIFASYTRLNGFTNTFNGNEFEAGILASKDYVRLKPYIGFGILLANATVTKAICINEQTQTALTPHLFIGTEIELPMTITFQLDLNQLVPSASFSLGYHF